MGIIVVGLDGSAPSRAALAWALAEAKLRGSTVRAVHAWMIPAIGAVDAPGALIPMGRYTDVSTDDIEKAAHEALEREIEGANAGLGVTVERVVAEGPAADAVLDASKDAELVVVGTRGHGALASIVLGSTSQHVIRHAQSPVVVVPAPSA